MMNIPRIALAFLFVPDQLSRAESEEAARTLSIAFLFSLLIFQKSLEPMELAAIARNLK
jgi:hypothetical protein